MAGRATLEVHLGRSGPTRKTEGDAPLRVLVFAKLSGRDVGPEDPLVARRVSADNLDAELARSAPSITAEIVPLGVREQISIAALDDLHPDRLVNAIAPLRKLLELARRLDDPRATESAVRDAAALLPETAAPDPLPSRATAAPKKKDEQLFARLLGRSPNDRDAHVKAKVRSLIQEAVAGESHPSPSQAATRYRDRAVEQLTEAVRSILTEPAFRDIERAWRSVHWLVSRLEDDQAEIYVVDLPQESLARSLAAHMERLDASPLYSLLTNGQSDAPWDVIVADYDFRLDESDLVLLATIGAIASRAGVRVFAHGGLDLCGCETLADAERPWEWTIADPDLANLWSEVRRHPAAHSISLATPRFLLRQPYGARTDPIESFAFEELPPRPQRERFFWGNPAFACGYLAAVQRIRNGEEPQEPVPQRVTGLPVPVYDDGSGEAVQPPLEVLLSERARAAVAQAGLIAFAGGSNVDYIAAESITTLFDT